MSNVKQVLENLGYKLVQDGLYYYRTKPLYRSSGNATSLRISKKSGWFVDFSSNDSGPLHALVQLTLNIKDAAEAKKWLRDHEFDDSVRVQEKPMVTSSKVYPTDLLEKLIKNDSYWNDRKIPSSVLEKYKGGVSVSGSMAARYVFPIFDDNDRIVGFAGRDITGKNTSKWILVGEKKNWNFPVQNHQNIIDRKEVILVESIGDMLTLDRAGFPNALCLFGVNISDKIISTLVRLNPSKIIVATNNDADNNDVGNKAAVKIKERLNSFFEESKVIISLPKHRNDFGDMIDEEIQAWYEQTFEIETEGKLSI